MFSEVSPSKGAEFDHLSLIDHRFDKRENYRQAIIRSGVLDNLIERSGNVIRFRHFRTFEKLHLRYLSFDMTQFLWKSLLFDPVHFAAYSESVTNMDSWIFQTDRDEPLILLELKRTLLSDQEWCRLIKSYLM